MNLKMKSVTTIAPKASNKARTGADGRRYFVLKPLSPGEVAIIKTMVALGHSLKSIATAISRSPDGVAKILRRLGLRTVHKKRLDELNQRKLKAMSERLASRGSANVP